MLSSCHIIMLPDDLLVYVGDLLGPTRCCWNLAMCSRLMWQILGDAHLQLRSHHHHGQCGEMHQCTYLQICFWCMHSFVRKSSNSNDDHDVIVLPRMLRAWYSLRSLFLEVPIPWLDRLEFLSGAPHLWMLQLHLITSACDQHTMSTPDLFQPLRSLPRLRSLRSDRTNSFNSVSPPIPPFSAVNRDI